MVGAAVAWSFAEAVERNTDKHGCGAITPLTDERG